MYIYVCMYILILTYIYRQRDRILNIEGVDLWLIALVLAWQQNLEIIYTYLYVCIQLFFLAIICVF